MIEAGHYSRDAPAPGTAIDGTGSARRGIVYNCAHFTYCLDRLVQDDCPMFHIKQTLEALISATITQVAGVEARALVNPSSRPEFGDYQANGVMAVAKQMKKNPRELAADVVAALPVVALIDRVEVAGPGFINIFLSDAWLAENASYFATAPAQLIGQTDRPQKIVVDYSGPNLAKEMHVGHLRGTIVGDCIVRVLEAVGHDVVRQNHVGDWGTQFGMLIAHMESLREQNDSAEAEMSVQLSDLESFYRQAKSRFDQEPGFADLARSYVVKLQAGDEACLAAWRLFITESLRHCEDIYALLGVTLKPDDLKPESFYNNV